MKYCISSGKTQAKFQTLGGQLTSLEKDGIEYLWQGNPGFWGGQAPVCFPIVGALKDGKATAFGKPCTMPRHGVARTQDFTVLEQQTNSITFTLRANTQTLVQYPFDFELRIQYTLNGSFLTVGYQITNWGATPMPFAIGGHPAFRCPLVQGDRFEDYVVSFAQAEPAPPMRPDPVTGLVALDRGCPLLEHQRFLPLQHSLFYEDSLVFASTCSKTVTLCNSKSGFGVELHFADFHNLLIWSSSNDGDFIALEPWSAMPACTNETDKLEKRRQFTVLPALESTQLRFQIRLLSPKDH